MKNKKENTKTVIHVRFINISLYSIQPLKEPETQTANFMFIHPTSILSPHINNHLPVRSLAEPLRRKVMASQQES